MPRLICAAFARIDPWLRTTPFGIPSDPDVNRITAGSSGLDFRITRRGCRKAHRISQSLSSKPELRLQVFEVKNVHRRELLNQVAQLCLLDEGARSDDGLHLTRCGRRSASRRART